MDQEILSIVMILILIILVILLFILNNTKKFDNASKKRILENLKQLKLIINTKNPLIYRDALIRLDSLLNKSLQLYYRNNESCGVNLKRAKELFNKKDYDYIWQIHKLRNNVVHENIEISYSQIIQGYNIIDKAIKKIFNE